MSFQNYDKHRDSHTPSLEGSRSGGSLGGKNTRRSGGSLGSQRTRRFGQIKRPSGSLGGQTKPAGSLGGQTKEPEGSLGGQTKEPEGSLGGQTKEPAGTLGGQTKEPEGSLGGQTKEPAGTLGGQTKEPAGTLGGQTKQPEGGQSKRTAGDQESSRPAGSPADLQYWESLGKKKTKKPSDPQVDKATKKSSKYRGIRHIKYGYELLGGEDFKITYGSPYGQQTKQSSESQDSQGSKRSGGSRDSQKTKQQDENKGKPVITSNRAIVTRSSSESSTGSSGSSSKSDLNRNPSTRSEFTGDLLFPEDTRRMPTAEMYRNQPRPVLTQPQSSSIVSIVSTKDYEVSFIPAPKRPWSTGLFDCFSDLKTSLYVICCWFRAVQDIADELGENSCLMPCFIPCWLYYFRMDVRHYLNIEGDQSDDRRVTICCDRCVACQILREFKILRARMKDKMRRVKFSEVSEV